MEIRQYLYDSPEFVDYMKWLSGSDEWRAEHGMDFHRSKGKKFFVLLSDSEFAGVCSKRGKYIGDVHILPQFRGKGHGTTLLLHVSNPGDWLVTDNPVMCHILDKMGYVSTGNRGKYQKWVKVK